METHQNTGLNEHGCDHYRRRCKLVSPCCGEVFWCRHCHNAVKDHSELDPTKRHVLDRSQVTEVVCALCNTRQPCAPSCSSCGVCFGRYSCMTCHFFDDDISKEQFHCDQCGICRVGGRQNFFHCQTCNCCYSLALRDGHACVTNSMHQNCPVCFEYLFDSLAPIAVLPCGHTIHQGCLANLQTHDNMTCPICLKSTMHPQQMQAVWREYDRVVAGTAMPEEYRNMVVGVLCNDCHARSEVGFHVVGHKCGSCGSYNTRRV